jgi:transcriptional regulator with XRE-family HTH domain
MEIMADRIKKLRKSKGWSQEQLARSLGVALNTVQRWEMGKTKPSPLAREKLDEVLSIMTEGN